MDYILPVVAVLLSLITLIMVYIFRPKNDTGNGLFLKIDEIGKTIARLDSGLKEEFRVNREETQKISKENREELNTSLKELKKELTETLKAITDQDANNLKEINKTLDDKLALLAKNSKDASTELRLELEKSLKGVQENFDKNIESFNTTQKDKFEKLDKKQIELIDTTTKKLDNVRQTVEEKLELINKSSKEFNVELRSDLEKSLKGVQDNFDKNVEAFNKLQKEKFEQLELNQNKLIESTEKKLEQMRETVEEKLQETLNKRLGQSFETVGKQLQAVQEGLGEMKTLANDVGGLKKVLGNVKMRGGIGEMQLSLLLEQILAPDQYAANVKTKHGSGDLVEFAIKLPGKEDGLDQVWLPIDAKFPKDYYEQLQTAHDAGDIGQIDLAQKNLENAVKKMAKDISEKYIDPPNTTDFAIMFLPFEGIYAEVVRKSALLEDLQRNYKIIVTGPTTLAAILNSLQMGFKTLAIQKSSSEVWKVLGAVKTEFDKFGGLLEKSQKHFQAGVDDLDTLIGTRTRMIKSKLRSIEAMTEGEAKLMLPEMNSSEGGEAEDDK